jgi:hypothetical protein
MQERGSSHDHATQIIQSCDHLPGASEFGIESQPPEGPPLTPLSVPHSRLKHDQTLRMNRAEYPCLSHVIGELVCFQLFILPVQDSDGIFQNQTIILEYFGICWEICKSVKGWLHVNEVIYVDRHPQAARTGASEWCLWTIESYHCSCFYSNWSPSSVPAGESRIVCRGSFS